VQLPPAQTTIVFDLDNTVVHSRIDFAGCRRALIALLREAGLPSDELAVDGPNRRSIGQIIELGDEHDARRGTNLGPTMWRLVEAYEREGMHLATVEADAGPTLAELRRRGHALSILTNNAHTSALEALVKFGLRPYFDAILAREDVPAMKPSPSGLETARQRLGPRAERLLMVGDSWLDGQAAHAAGCPFIAFRPRDGELEARQISPLAVIQQLTELLTLDG
jgi:phosphoglycolate phosphatase